MLQPRRPYLLSQERGVKTQVSEQVSSGRLTLPYRDRARRPGLGTYWDSDCVNVAKYGCETVPRQTDGSWRTGGNGARTSHLSEQQRGTEAA